MRDSVISFRTSENLHKALEQISVMDRRSLSSVVENILYEYLKQREPKAVDEEKRRYPRIEISAPALVSSLDGTVYAGVINDVSLGGINLSIPDGFPHEMRPNSRISVIFTLRRSEKPLTVQCALRHVRSNGQNSIGASLIDTDFHSYRALQDYLMEATSQCPVPGEDAPTNGKGTRSFTLV